jgi:transketolase
MKKQFFDIMLDIMEQNKDVYLLFCGLGYPRYDEFKKKFKDRAINTEASEQTALDMAVGLAYSGKIPFVYTITPFFYRGWETIRTYISHERLNVKLVGAGRDDDYSKHDGYSHDAGDIGKYMDIEVMRQSYPMDLTELDFFIRYMINSTHPWFLSLRK